jgi:Ni/Co efflux regulator RcnB
MKKNRIVATVLCVSLGLAASASFAQPAPQGPQGWDNHGAPDHGPAMNPHDEHYDHDHHYAPPPPQHVEHMEHHEEWRQGERLSNDYRNHQYVIDNWHEHNLHQPPRGYQWVGVNGDYLLVAAASGIIAQIVMGH